MLSHARARTHNTHTHPSYAQDFPECYQARVLVARRHQPDEQRPPMGSHSPMSCGVPKFRETCKLRLYRTLPLNCRVTFFVLIFILVFLEKKLRFRSNEDSRWKDKHISHPWKQAGERFSSVGAVLKKTGIFQSDSKAAKGCIQFSVLIRPSH